MKPEPEYAISDPRDESEAEIERLLEDAYPVPPVPPSLLKRLDAAVAQQWGDSPQLVRGSSHWLSRVSSRVARSWKTWPVAASLLIAMFLIARSGEAHAFTWASVVEALSKQAVVKIEQTSAAVTESRWISIGEKKMVERSGGGERYVDVGRGLVLDRGRAESQAKRRKLAENSSASNPERVALALLLGDVEIEGSALRLPDWRVIREKAERSGAVVLLDVTVGSSVPDNELALRLTIDPNSRLPREYIVTNQEGVIRQGQLEYPRARFELVVAESFPADMQIVDVLPHESTGDAASESVAVSDSKSGVGTDGSGAGSSLAESTSEGPTVVFTGAASLGWKPLGARRLSATKAVAEIDATLEQVWQVNEVTPVPAASDEELLRRVYLDLTGRTPTVMEARTYLNDRSPDRYSALVERLLASPDHATHLATVWRTFLLPEGVDLARFGGVKAFDDWLAEQFGKNIAYDQLVRELLLAEGRLSKSGPLLFYSALKLDADQLAGRTARVFLGMRLDCAQCHDDPFEPWTQQDFWSFAAFFARISRPQAALESVSTVMQVRDIDRGEVRMPGGEEPIAPKFLDGTNVEDTPGAEVRRRQLARWLTGAENPYFARAAVNRVWAHLFGRGIVEPVDGFGKQNQPRSPELLDLLAGQFIASGFDLRGIFRTIVLSRAYQLSSGSDVDDPKRRDWFAQMSVKMLTAEQIYDCVAVATMLVPTESAGFTIERLSNSSRDQFLQQFKTVAGRVTEYQNGIPQALTLMNGVLIRDATGLASSGLLKSLDAPFFTDDQRIEVVYLATLSRRPTVSEWSMLSEYVRDRDPNTSIQEPLADILWALLNSAEFTMNH